MAQPPRPERENAKAGAGRGSSGSEASGQDPMNKFRALTKRLLAVSREEVAEREALRGRKSKAERKK